MLPFWEMMDVKNFIILVEWASKLLQQLLQSGHSLELGLEVLNYENRDY